MPRPAVYAMVAVLDSRAVPLLGILQAAFMAVALKLQPAVHAAVACCWMELSIPWVLVLQAAGKARASPCAVARIQSDVAQPATLTNMLCHAALLHKETSCLANLAAKHSLSAIALTF